MTSPAIRLRHEAIHPVQVSVEPAIEERNRLTVAFRPLLALPHLILVGGPLAMFFSWTSESETGGLRYEWGAGGLFGALAAGAALIAWFAILFTGRYPQGLRDLVAMYLRWRVRVVAYAALLRDEYPPFGEGAYPAAIELKQPDGPRDRLTVGLRPILVIPQLIAVWAIGIAWAVTTIIAWFAILITRRFPKGLYNFSVGAFRWTTRVEAYLLLLHDEYPPFSLD
jgi:hypothetical protein